jgi:hypothetical protein
LRIGRTGVIGGGLVQFGGRTVLLVGFGWLAICFVDGHRLLLHWAKV